MPNVSRSKDNQTVKLGQLIERNKRKKKFFKDHAENVAGALVPDFFLFFKKVLQEVK